MPDDFNYNEAMPEILRLASFIEAQKIPSGKFVEHKVFRGLRDLNGNGVLTGLTNISSVTAKQIVDGVEVPMHGKLYYQGIDVEEIVAGFLKEDRFGFEETIYLLLFGHLPTAGELKDFEALLSSMSSLPPSFVRDFILRTPDKDMMNTLARSVLTLYHYDDNSDDTSLPNMLRQCLRLIAQFPLLAVYGYHAYQHYENDQSLIIHRPKPDLSIAENILHMLRHDSNYSELEAKILDLSLVLHAEHGGGNNSAFTTHVVASSGTDTYSAVAAALGSLKGPRHGGANNRVMAMFDEIKAKVGDWDDDEEVSAYCKKLLHKEAFDRSGLIYGIGHAVYSLSDPRAVVFEGFVKKLSAEKDREAEYRLYANVARLAPDLIAKERRMYKGVSANIDFYSGFVYDMLNLPMELFTPIFAISRIAGWSAHRIEEMHSGGRIIRPAYKSIAPSRQYIPLFERS